MNKLYKVWDEFLTAFVRLFQIRVNASDVKSMATGTISVKEQIMFFKRLSIMLQAQLPIIDSLRMIVAEAQTGRLTRVINHVIDSVAKGETLSSALAHYKKTFNFFTVSIIAIGEASGTLPENLEYLATELKKKQDLRKQIFGALLYPAIVIATTLAITFFLIVYVFPKIIPIFLSVNATLPWSTKFLMILSTTLTEHTFLILLVLFGLFVTVLLLVRVPFIIFKINLVLLRLPLIGTLISYYNIAQLTRTLALLLGNNVPITHALLITKNSTHNGPYRMALEEIMQDVALGKSMSVHMRKLPHLFPVIVIHMIEAGEQTGNLPVMLAYVSDVFETDIKDITKNLTTIVEPVLMLVMGLIVGFIAISIITPIYGITQNLHQ